MRIIKFTFIAGLMLAISSPASAFGTQYSQLPTYGAAEEFCQNSLTDHSLLSDCRDWASSLMSDGWTEQKLLESEYSFKFFVCSRKPIKRNSRKWKDCQESVNNAFLRPPISASDVASKDKNLTNDQNTKNSNTFECELPDGSKVDISKKQCDSIARKVLSEAVTGGTEPDQEVRKLHQKPQKLTSAYIVSVSSECDDVNDDRLNSVLCVCNKIGDLNLINSSNVAPIHYEYYPLACARAKVLSSKVQKGQMSLDEAILIHLEKRELFMESWRNRNVPPSTPPSYHAESIPQQNKAGVLNNRDFQKGLLMMQGLSPMDAELYINDPQTYELKKLRKALENPNRSTNCRTTYDRSGASTHCW